MSFAFASYDERPKLEERRQATLVGALELVSIDRKADRGVYVEPIVWMHHRV